MEEVGARVRCRRHTRSHMPRLPYLNASLGAYLRATLAEKSSFEMVPLPRSFLSREGDIGYAGYKMQELD